MRAWTDEVIALLVTVAAALVVVAAWLAGAWWIGRLS